MANILVEGEEKEGIKRNTALALIQRRATASFQVLPTTSHGTSRFLNCKHARSLCTTELKVVHLLSQQLHLPIKL